MIKKDCIYLNRASDTQFVLLANLAKHIFFIIDKQFEIICSNGAFFSTNISSQKEEVVICCWKRTGEQEGLMPQSLRSCRKCESELTQSTR